MSEYIDYMRSKQFNLAMQAVANNSAEYYLALFCGKFNDISYLPRRKVRKELEELANTIQNVSYLSPELTTASQVLADILSEKPCQIEYRVWRKLNYDLGTYAYEPEDFEFDSEGNSQSVPNYPLQSAMLLKGETTTAYDFNDLDLLFKYLSPTNISNTVEHIAKCFYVWAVVKIKLLDYCEFVKPQACPNEKCREGTIEERSYRCKTCGSYRIIHYEDAKEAQEQIYRTRERIRKQEIYDALPPRAQRWEAYKPYLPFMTFLGLIDLGLLLFLIFG